MNPGLFKQKDASVNPRISESQNSRIIVMECESSKYCNFSYRFLDSWDSRILHNKN